MNLSKKDRQILINSLSDRIKRNPYDTEAKVNEWTSYVILRIYSINIIP